MSIYYGKPKLAFALPPGSPLTKIWHPVPVLTAWQPVVWLARGQPTRLPPAQTPDVYINTLCRNTKTHHPWQQSQAYFDWLVSVFTAPGDVVADPMLGAATTAIACLKQARRFVGCEANSKTFRIAQERLGRTSTRLSGPVLPG